MPNTPVSFDWPYHLLISLDPKLRITGIAQYTATVEVDNLKDRNPVPGREPRTSPPVDISEKQMRDILGDGGDLVAGIASARTKMAVADAKLEEVTTSLQQTQEALTASQNQCAELSAELASAKGECASQAQEMRAMQGRLDKYADVVRKMQSQIDKMSQEIEDEFDIQNAPIEDQFFDDGD